ncbi:MAG: MBL fold metallo-hydrolase [Lachnospiraceae bacterium]|nr:MBL fold metallo-hydrolase [Lachnospiraceae bacterium]
MENKNENAFDEIERIRKQQEAKNRIRRRRRRNRLAKKILPGLLLLCVITAGILFVYFPLVRKDFRFLPFLRPETPDTYDFTEQIEDPEHSLVITFVDVGEGDSTILYDPKRESVLILDGGTQEYASHVAECAKRFGNVKDVRLLLTHPHADHAQGLTQIVRMKSLPVIGLYYSAPTAAESGFAPLRTQITALGLPMVPLKAGDELAFGDAVIHIVSPKNEPYEDLNNASIAALVVHEGHKILIAGDMERDAETVLCDDEVLSARIRDVDILRVAHHGSNSSTSYRFLDITYPGIAVISVGADNAYGHPSDNVLSRLEDLARTRSGGTSILRTDREGDIVFASGPAGIKRLK